jgi:hypothetical protein
VYLITLMDLFGIPWPFIYLLFLRDSLIYCTAHSHFLWLRLRHIKAHGDLDAPKLSYLKKNKIELNTQVRYDEIFVHFVFVLREAFSWIFCLEKFVCVQCPVFKTIDMTNIIEVATAALARIGVVRYVKKWFLWIMYKNKWTCIF